MEEKSPLTRDEISTQYHRFIEQLREEVSQLFWLYNFFFAIESAMMGTVFVVKLSESSLRLTEFIGLVIALYWLAIMCWKDDWRRYWLRRIAYIEEEELKIPEKLRMWPSPSSFFSFERHGLWNLLFLLPLVFSLAWIVLLMLSFLGIRFPDVYAIGALP